MKHKKLIVVFLLALWPGLAGAQTKLKVAYPTTVGSMAVVWVAKDARLFGADKPALLIVLRRRTDRLQE